LHFSGGSQDYKLKATMENLQSSYLQNLLN
jgi:hypothetical protein